ncbi:MAG: hypothetical protein GEV11_03160 [Streptosporangiales bacterium]|nr:hypothetical protein [Streptosporangiales bacterium]
MRIMCVGDSMTIGVPGDYTWRHRLFQHLRRTAPPVDFVGPEQGLYDRDRNVVVSRGYRDPLFPRAHAAGWGRGLRHLAGEIGEHVARHRPTLLLTMLGLIDLGFYAHVQETEEHLRRFITAARAADPDIGLVLAEVPPAVRARDDAWFAAECVQYNARLRDCAAELGTARSPLVTAALTDAYDIDADTYDGTHPNESGEHKIAAMFADALCHGLGIGAPYPVVPEMLTVDADGMPVLPA